MTTDEILKFAASIGSVYRSPYLYPHGDCSTELYRRLVAFVEEYDKLEDSTTLDLYPIQAMFTELWMDYSVLSPESSALLASNTKEGIQARQTLLDEMSKHLSQLEQVKFERAKKEEEQANVMREKSRLWREARAKEEEERARKEP